MRLAVPTGPGTARVPLPPGRLETDTEDVAAIDGIGQLGRLLGRAGADLAWAILDEDKREIASWVALRVVDLDGRSLGAARVALRAADALDHEERVVETPMGTGLRIRQRYPVSEQGRREIVADSVSWSWRLGGDMMLLMTSNTTQLMYAERVATEVDALAERIALVD